MRSRRTVRFHFNGNIIHKPRKKPQSRDILNYIQNVYMDGVNLNDMIGLHTMIEEKYKNG